jgi:hypothetical protein
MEVVLTPECREVLARLDLSEERVTATFNNRTRGMLVPGNPARIYGVRWFDDSQIVFVSGTITASRREGERLYIDAVSANLGLVLRQALPAGGITPELRMEELLLLVAESFGIPVQCHPDGRPMTLYSGRWDGSGVSVAEAYPDDTVLVSGSFDPSENTCSYVWAFSLNRYLDWFMNPGVYTGVFPQWVVEAADEVESEGGAEQHRLTFKPCAHAVGDEREFRGDEQQRVVSCLEFELPFSIPHLQGGCRWSRRSEMIDMER